ncbi:unnamed protein product [Dibothriocephalus latus]|uniref:Uncharacterized protein n=1 Tax=Dibothriocephalus latus TaxID=60516 RepID=A0A3P7ML91_DIBLA|nr:unnamed protein product [Dibothriocephalus latus]
MCAAEASAARSDSVGETVEYEAAPLAERRKPSAGRLRGSKRLPWDPRDEVVNLATAAPMSLSLCSPAIAQASPKSKPRRSKVAHSDANSADTAQPQDIFNMAPLSDDSILCRSVQNNYQSETFPRKSTISSSRHCLLHSPSSSPLALALLLFIPFPSPFFFSA